MAEDVCPVHPQKSGPGTTWPIPYDRDPDIAQPDTQLRLWRSGGRTYLAIEQAAASLAVIVHLNRLAARELLRSLGAALAAWEKQEPEFRTLPVEAEEEAPDT